MSQTQNVLSETERKAVKLIKSKEAIKRHKISDLLKMSFKKSLSTTPFIALDPVKCEKRATVLPNAQPLSHL